MDSSSIVSFNNDSTFQSTLKGDNNISVHELALHAMRDRCLLLQKRINALENENMRLKIDISKNSETQYIPLQDDEKFQLSQKIAELTKQKSQLMHHVFMVSCENRNLWNKISNIKAIEKPFHNPKPLLRTNTYIHSTPKGSANYQEKFSESSLEEISLKLINSYIQEKSQMVEQYEQMVQLQNSSDDDILNIDSIGFNYMDEQPTDSLKDIHSHIDKLQHLKQELANQEKELKLVVSKIETILRVGYKCPSCIANNTKVSSEHKEIETSDSLANWATPTDSTNFNNYNEMNSSAIKNIDNYEPSQAEPRDKICPMCGRVFMKDILFAEFQTHVESHFIGDTEPDSIMDNFDNVSNSFENGI